ncbi:hypothetical protein [Mesorhizobium sp. M0058]
MLTQFQVLLIVLIAFFADLLFGSRVPRQWFYGAILIILIVLLLLGVVRY